MNENDFEPTAEDYARFWATVQTNAHADAMVEEAAESIWHTIDNMPGAEFDQARSIARSVIATVSDYARKHALPSRAAASLTPEGKDHLADVLADHLAALEYRLRETVAEWREMGEEKITAEIAAGVIETDMRTAAQAARGGA